MTSSLQSRRQEKAAIALTLVQCLLSYEHLESRNSALFTSETIKTGTRPGPCRDGW